MHFGFSKLTMAAAVLLATLCLAPQTQAGSGPEIDANVRATMGDFVREVPSGREVANKAVAILVFPNHRQGGLRHRRRVWRRRPAHSRPHRRLLQHHFGLDRLSVRRTGAVRDHHVHDRGGACQIPAHDGWKVGVDGSVAIITVGAGGQIDTNSVRSPVVGFIFDQKGLMYNLTLEGSKISRIDR